MYNEAVVLSPLTQNFSFIDLIYAIRKENGTVPFGTEQFHGFCVNVKRFQMVLEVNTTKEECALKHKTQVFYDIWPVI